MIRTLLTEALKTTLMLVVVSVVAFVALDLTGQIDWWGTRALAEDAGVPRERALARDVPRLLNPHVADAQVRTRDDLIALRSASTRDAARVRLLRRGTAALPAMLAELRTLPITSRDAALEILATMAPTITGGERPPADAAAALEYWDRFYALRGLDFRGAYVRRIVQRLVEHESRNAEEQLIRLGTYALPAVFDVLDEPVTTDGARRITALLSDLTGLPLRLAPDASVTRMRQVVDTWRAWWFVQRLEYETLSDVSRFAGHVTETRYGRWLTRLLAGRGGRSSVTDRPLAIEVRERALRSSFVGGLGGLLAIAAVVAFGGGPALRRRPIGTKLLDLTGALIPGLVAFVLGFVVLVQVAAAPRPAGPLATDVFARWPRMALAVVVLAPLAALWLRRRFARVALHAVRKEAESWARESRHPKPAQVLRHGMRVGLASLLAPLALAALPIVLMAMLVEPATGVAGMGQLTVQSINHFDPPWLILAIISVVPVWLARHWAQRVMLWALGTPATRKTADGRTVETPRHTFNPPPHDPAPTPPTPSPNAE